MNVYKGHSHIFYLQVDKFDFPNGSGNDPDQRQIIQMIKDLRYHLSVNALDQISDWCLDEIDKSQKYSPAKVTWYDDKILEIAKRSDYIREAIKEKMERENG